MPEDREQGPDSSSATLTRLPGRYLQPQTHTRPYGMRFRISCGAQLETDEARRHIRGPLCHIEGANWPDVDNHPPLRAPFSEAESFGNSSLGPALIGVSGLFDLVETLVRLGKFASFGYQRSTPRLSRTAD